MKLLKYIIIILVIVGVAYFVNQSFKNDVQPVENTDEVVTETQNKIETVNLAVGIPHTIQWNSQDIVSDTVTINLIKKISNEGVDTYEFVKTIAEATFNDGLESWSPLATDIGTDLYIQVACNGSSEACQSAMVKSPITVMEASGSSTAAVLDAVR